MRFSSNSDISHFSLMSYLIVVVCFVTYLIIGEWLGEAVFSVLFTWFSPETLQVDYFKSIQNLKDEGRALSALIDAKIYVFGGMILINHFIQAVFTLAVRFFKIKVSEKAIKRATIATHIYTVMVIVCFVSLFYLMKHNLFEVAEYVALGFWVVSSAISYFSILFLILSIKDEINAK